MNTILIIWIITMFILIVGFPLFLYYIERDKKISIITAIVMFIISGIITIFIRNNLILQTMPKEMELELPINQNVLNNIKHQTDAKQKTSDKTEDTKTTKNPVTEKQITMPDIKIKMPDNMAVIFFGDSRTNGMDISCSITDTERMFIVAKNGAGYDWASDTGLLEINSLMTEHPEWNWTIISNFGVNDITNANKYLELYDILGRQSNLLIMSVNPTNGGSVSNEKIQNFNDVMSSSGYMYIDTYSMLMKNGYETIDGIHYDTETYRKIYSHICNILHIS